MRKKNDGKGRMGGRKAGTPNKVSGTVKEWIASIIDGNRKQFEDDLKELEPGERVRIISNLLQYVTPKMQSISPAEMLEEEYRKLEELLESAPDEAIDEIVERVKRLKDESGRTETED